MIKRLLSIGIIAMMILGITGCNGSYKTTDISEYRQFTEHKESGIYGRLDLFPDSGLVPINYYYSYNDGLMDASYQIFAEFQYSEDEYTNEVERLSKITGEGEKKLLIKYDESNFSYPAYAVQLGNNSTNEYALLIEEEHKIVYVFLQFVKTGSVKFDKNYLPKGYSGYGDCSKSYSIYSDFSY